MSACDLVRAVAWEAGAVALIDQRRLPQVYTVLRCCTAHEVAAAITTMVVRGAPAIAIAAAYGVVLGAQAGATGEAIDELERARPTAVNLRWAMARMRQAAARDSRPEALLAEARLIHEEDVAANHAIGATGAGYFSAGGGVLTHCNTGALATGGYGTALGVVRAAWAAGALTHVYVGETRPWLQGSRLTAWELMQEGIPASVLADAAAPALLRKGEVAWVVVGADRISANGDVANKIGTYALALAARAHGVGFMVAAPSTTVDWQAASGADIPIELRAADEILSVQGERIAADDVAAWNPVFDVTPAELVDVLVTEKGAVERPDAARLQALLHGPAADAAGSA